MLPLPTILTDIPTEIPTEIPTDILIATNNTITTHAMVMLMLIHTLSQTPSHSPHLCKARIAQRIALN